MNDQSPAPMGHNMPPEEIDPREAALEPFSDFIEEAQNWADGTPVENVEQMEAVDGLLKQVKAADKAVQEARDSDVKPLHDAWKARVAFWKITLDDLDRIKKALTKVSNDFKVKLAREKEEKAQKEREAAWAKQREAEEAARLAEERGSIDDLRAADAAKQEALDAKKAASAASKDKVKGLRTIWKWAFDGEDARKKALNWIARNDRDAMTAFIEAYVAKNFRDKQIDGVKVWDEKESY